MANNNGQGVAIRPYKVKKRSYKVKKKNNDNYTFVYILYNESSGRIAPENGSEVDS